MTDKREVTVSEQVVTCHLQHMGLFACFGPPFPVDAS